MTRRKIACLLFLAGWMAVPASAFPHAVEPYKDPKRPIEERIKDLLQRLTLEEKAAQLLQIETIPWDANSADYADPAVLQKTLEKAFHGRSVGLVLSPIGWPARDTLRFNKAVHEYSLNQTRLGVPVMIFHCNMHGVMSLDATVFPQYIAQGATWNPDLIGEMAEAIARETAALGVSHGVGPGLELARDPRWGRVEETFGECPTLAARLGVAFIKGFQGPNAWAGIPADRIATVAYWTCGSSTPAGGINTAASSVGERELRSLYFVPHVAAIREGRLTSLMASYNATDGIPTHANRWALTTVLRGEWGFQGYVYCDWGGIARLENPQHIAASPAEAGRLAIKAGVDIEASGGYAYPHLPALVKAGRVSEAEIDTACARVLRIKYLLGLFDGKRVFPDPASLSGMVHTPAHVSLARRAAEESVILLKNDGRLLPLDPVKLNSIAVIGPNADQVEYGDYSATKDNSTGVTVLRGIRDLLKGSGVEVRYAKGCDLVAPETGGFREAVEAARQSEAAIVVIGDTSLANASRNGETDPRIVKLATVGEGFDRAELGPPGVQEDLVKAVAATGKPTVVVMVQGRAFSVPWIKEHVPAILSAFYPGEEGGRAIADILFGRINPSGRLPVSIPQSVGHIPTTYDYLPQGRIPYIFSTADPLWSFGFGLSYSTFEYSDLQIETPEIGSSGAVRFSFAVSNTGSREGREVAQVYFHQDVTSVATPLKRLIRFQKVSLKPGQKRRLEFSIPADEMAVWNVEMKRVVEPGGFELMVGPAAEDGYIKLRGTFQVKHD
jgi:beta-glucosidase